ncbi:MAG: polysaccharide deacetylase family protein [Bauldia sp.]|nr:polysaccharide deacetylase family protein [Bauldia sp.]
MFDLNLKKLGLNALYFSGAHRWLAGLGAGAGAVLMFHHVRPGKPAPFAPNAHLEVTPEFLQESVRLVREKGMDIVDLDEARRRLLERDPRPFCVITFDDGYRDNLVHAYPVLKAENAPFTIFVATGLVDRTADLWWRVVERVIAEQDAIEVEIGGALTRLATRSVAEKHQVYAHLMDWLMDEVDEDRQRLFVNDLAQRYGVDDKAMVDAEIMTWDELRRIAADPLVTIGAHTVAHHVLAKLPLARARAEIEGGARRLEAMLGVAPRHFAYPYGFEEAAGEREFRLLADLGFATAVTTRPGVLMPTHAASNTAWPRVSVNGHFQSRRYLEVLLSGVAYALYDRARGLRPASPKRAPVAASASTR